MTHKVFIVIPAFNEQSRLPKVVESVGKIFPQEQIVVVDDGSKNPVELPLKYSGFLLRHKTNLGKGSAMKTGADFALSKGASAIIFMDADLQHDASYLPRFVSLLDDGYDVVFGSRRPTLKAPLIRLLGNKLASVYLNVLFGIYVSDILSGFRAMTRKAYGLLSWQSARYGVETEMIARLGKHKNKLRFTEFPIESVYIDKYKGVTIIDAIKILGNSLWWKLS